MLSCQFPVNREHYRKLIRVAPELTHSRSLTGRKCSFFTSKITIATHMDDKNLVIEGQLSFDAIERFAQRLENRCPNQLQLPLNLKLGQFGMVAQFAQLVITWAKRSERGNLSLPLSCDDEQIAEQLRRFHKRPGGLVASTMAKSVGSLDGRDLTSDSIASARSQFEQYRRKDSPQMSLFPESDLAEPAIPSFGKSVFLPCSDSRRSGKIPQLYFSNGELRDKSQVRSVIDEVIRKLSHNEVDPKNRITPFTPSAMRDLTVVLYELFDNTDKWAITNWQGRPVRPSTRGIYFSLHDHASIRQEDTCGYRKPLSNYLSHDRLSSDSVQFLELSVFDSGPGMASRFLERPISSSDTADDELKAIEGCFAKGATSSKNIRRGFGLYNVMKSLVSLEGFLLVRTGRLFLFRDSIARGLGFKESVFWNALSDWDSMSNKPSLNPKLEGTVFTILLPIGLGGNDA